MRAGVRNGVDFFHCPALPLRINEVLGLHAKELLHLPQPFGGVRDVADLRRQRFTHRLVLQRDGKVDQSAAGEVHR